MKKTIILFGIIGLSIILKAQRGDIRIMFYNVENLFDTYDDTTKRDNEFLPDGVKYWTSRKYYEKLNNITKIITAVGEDFQPPDIVGVCEIENRFVLEQLIKKTALSKFQYKIVHYESPDKRGIDVGLIYRKKNFKVLYSNNYKVSLGDAKRTTRDILYVKGLSKKDTLHIFINHWPSRWGGQLKSDPKRIAAAKTLRAIVDTIFQKSPNANIIIMGDFNDYADNNSMKKYLNAKYEDVQSFKNNELYNLTSLNNKNIKYGSHKYQGHWGILDQIVVSGSLLTKTNNLYTKKEFANVFSSDFILEKDIKFSGFQPFRTYIGMKYIGGFSDHLPIYLDLLKK